MEQQKSMGVSCDWERSRFTMDDVCARSVRETFCDLYEKGSYLQGQPYNQLVSQVPHRPVRR